MNGATVFQMVSGLGNSFGDAYAGAVKERQEAEAPGLLSNLMQAYRGGGAPAATPVPDAPAAAPASDGPKLPTFAQGTDIGRYASAIQANESSGNYRAIGPTHPKYGRALGAYQVMESNLPSWSREAVGREVSPDEFLGSPQIQDAIFRTKFGQSVAKYGNPQDAASVWFTGRPLAQGANAKDVLGTTGAEYVRRFNAGLGRASAGTAPALPATAMRMPGTSEARPAPAQTAAADAPAPGAMPVGFTVPEGASQGAVSVPAPSAAGFGGGRPQLTEELRSALNAAWRNPSTRSVAAQVFGQLLKGRDSPWELKEINGQSAWVNPQTREVLPIGERKAEAFTLSEGQSRFDASGRPIASVEKQIARPERDEGAKITAQIDARKNAAAGLGFVEGTPEWRAFVGTGKVGRELDISAADRKAINAAEDELPGIDSTLDTLRRAKELNGQTFTGVTSGARGWLGTALPDAMVPNAVADPKAAAATREFGQIMSMEAIKAMSQTLKGATTDREMARFMEILGDPSTPPDIRGRTIERMMTLAERQREIAQARITEMRDGTYYKRGGGAAEPGSRQRAPGPEQRAPGYAQPKSKADYDALPPGPYMAPDGQVRIKP